MAMITAAPTGTMRYKPNYKKRIKKKKMESQKKGVC
jgi:hypothetical protein